MKMNTFPNFSRWILIAGDITAFLLFAAVGRRAHSMGSALDDITATAVPFMIAWFVVGTFTGAFRDDAVSGAGSAARRVAFTWLAAFPLGYLLRAAMLGRFAHYTFAIVAGVFTLAALAGWRAAYAVYASRRGIVPRP